MTIHVNIGEAKTRLSELVAAAIRGEEVVLARAGQPQVRLTPVAERSEEERAARAARRRSAFGMFREELSGVDTSIEALKADRPDPDERLRRAFGPTD